LNNTVLILSGYNSSDPYSNQQMPTCQLQAYWPSYFQDIYLKADKCLYDAGNQRIFNQCCSSLDSKNSILTINPYRDPRPAASCDRKWSPVFVTFNIYSKGWNTDNGAKLRKQIQGCGAITGWSFKSDTAIQTDGSSANIGKYEAESETAFNLPITFETGCVGRAIASAGGPQGVEC
jgi:hypothetical protein